MKKQAHWIATGVLCIAFFGVARKAWMQYQDGMIGTNKFQIEVSSEVFPSFGVCTLFPQTDEAIKAKSIIVGARLDILHEGKIHR